MSRAGSSENPWRRLKARTLQWKRQRRRRSKQEVYDEAKKEEAPAEEKAGEPSDTQQNKEAPAEPESVENADEDKRNEPGRNITAPVAVDGGEGGESSAADVSTSEIHGAAHLEPETVDVVEVPSGESADNAVADIDETNQSEGGITAVAGDDEEVKKIKQEAIKAVSGDVPTLKVNSDEEVGGGRESETAHKEDCSSLLLPAPNIEPQVLERSLWC